MVGLKPAFFGFPMLGIGTGGGIHVLTCRCRRDGGRGGGE